MLKLEKIGIHEKIRKIGKPIATFGLTAGMTISFFSDNIKQQIQTKQQINSASISYENNNSTISKENYYSIIRRIKQINEKRGIKKYLLTKENINKIKELEISIENENDSIDFLKEFKNLETLKIIIKDENMNNIEKLPFISNLNSITIECENGFFTNENRIVLEEKFPNLKKIHFKSRSMIYEPGSIELLKNIEVLGINPGMNCDIDFTKLNSINTLEIYNSRPYDIAIWLNSEEYNALKQKNINIKFKENIEDKYLEISKKIDDIVAELNINELSSDKEKLDEILMYTLDNLKYDSEIRTANQNNVEHSELTKSFYENGELYGVFEKDTQICGNYAALVEALFDRVSKPWNSYIIRSQKHAWNIVRIDGDTYYVDSTWLDGLDVKLMNINLSSSLIKQGLTKGMDWYMQDINSDFIKEEQENNESHIPDHFPRYFEEEYNINEYTKQYSDIQDEKQETIEFKSYTDNVQINIKNKKINTQIGAIIGSLQGINASYKATYIAKQQITEEKLKTR